MWHPLLLPGDIIEKHDYRHLYQDVVFRTNNYPLSGEPSIYINVQACFVVASLIVGPDNDAYDASCIITPRRIGWVFDAFDAKRRKDK